MKTVLFAWELGSGFGHIARIRRLADRLARHSVRMVAAVKTLEAAKPLADIGLELVQAPAWPQVQSAALSSVTMADALAGLGMSDAEAFGELLSAWDHLLRQVDPDLLVADFSPAASLLARGRVPTLIAGNGFTVPPSDMTHFPLLHRYSPPLWDERRLLTMVNKAARRFGAQSLQRLPQLFSAEAYLVETFPLLDPHDMQRLAPVDGPALDRAPIARRPGADKILVYLARGYAIRPDIVSALLPFSETVSIYAPDLPDTQRSDLATAGALVHSQPMELAEALASTRLAIHFGGPGLACHAIAAGVPQLILSSQIEQELNGQALERVGIGRLVRSYRPDAVISADLIAQLRDDSDLADRAARSGEFHRTRLNEYDPLEKFEAKSLALLNF